MIAGFFWMKHKMKKITISRRIFNMSNTVTTNDRLLRLPQVLQLIPISKSSWWLGIREGRYPKPIKLGPRISAWKESDIIALFAPGQDDDDKETGDGRDNRHGA
jgi:predicted DNA-binding transcriptional regulator AlpA